MRTRVKICGITSLEDALAAVEAGADAIGFVFAESPRQVTIDQAKGIGQKLPPFVTIVGVFVDEKIPVVEKTYNEAGLNLAQLHGREDTEYMHSLDLPAIKSFCVKDESVLAQLDKYRQSTFLLDSYSAGVAGGTGKTFNWSIANKAKAFGRVILSGGLRSDNITDALAAVRPYAVDVSSGVENAPGQKDHDRIRAFIQKVREWDSQTN